MLGNLFRWGWIWHLFADCKLRKGSSTQPCMWDSGDQMCNSLGVEVPRLSVISLWKKCPQMEFPVLGVHFEGTCAGCYSSCEGPRRPSLSSLVPSVSAGWTQVTWNLLIHLNFVLRFSFNTFLLASLICQFPTLFCHLYDQIDRLVASFYL